MNLLWEHLEISLVAIVIAVLFGGIVGILIGEFQKTAKLTLGIINFYIQSHLFLGLAF